METADEPKTRRTAQGAAVRDALGGHDGFQSAQELYATLRGRGLKIGLSTVYRHLQLLTEQGVIDSIHSPDGETTYRLCGTIPAGHHHHHVVCRVCGRAEDVEGRAIERWAAEMAARHGYSDVDHTIEIYGICPACAGAGAV